MCDYSLGCYQSRKAVVGETLVTRRFPSGTQGFVSPEEPEVAVCLREGTPLVLRNIPEYLQRQLGVEREAPAVFHRLSRQRRQWWWVFEPQLYHRDGLVFGNGVRILLNDLSEDLHADVLSQAVTGGPRTEEKKEVEEFEPVET